MRRREFIALLGGAAVQVREVWSIGHQTSRVDVLPRTEYRRQSRGQRQGVDANPVGVCERVASDIKCVRAALERLKGGRDIIRSSDFECDDLEAEGARRCLNLANFEHEGRIADICQDRQPVEPGDDLAQEFESLAGSIGVLGRQTWSPRLGSRRSRWRADRSQGRTRLE